MREPIKSIDDFIDWIERLSGNLLFYRGLANAAWEVSASAWRRIESSDNIAPSASVFQRSITQLLDNAGLCGFNQDQGKTLSDLELLATLQHNGAATCLIDFTTNPLIALWFACQEEPRESGKVVAMPTDDIELFSTVSYQNLKKPIEEFLYKDNKLWKWIPSPLSNRIVAQQSIFVFGEGEIQEQRYEKVTIDGSSKKEISAELEKRFGITEQHLFNDSTGYALSNAHDKPYTDYTEEDYFNSGVEFQQKEDLEKARAAYDKAIEIKPRFAEAYHNRGSAKHALGDPEGAIADFDKAIEINPQFAAAYSGRGIAKYTLGDPEGAIADCDKAIEINPQDAEAYHNRGTAKHALGDHQGAVIDYNKAIAIKPQYAKAYHSRGLVKQQSGDEAGANEDFAKAAALKRKRE